jgi:hypothetical protein
MIGDKTASHKVTFDFDFDITGQDSRETESAENCRSW